jgi:Flp pilus assembly protein TadD
MTPDAFVEALRRAMALLNDGRAPEARPQIEELMAARPEQPDPNALLGLALDQLGDPAQGAAMLRRASWRQPRRSIRSSWRGCWRALASRRRRRKPIAATWRLRPATRPRATTWAPPCSTPARRSRRKKRCVRP